MTQLSPDQRNYYYLIEAARAGIHKPILAALYAVHQQPTLVDGETGLGISSINRIALEQVNSLPEQVQYAANTLRSLTGALIAEGWPGSDLWMSEQGRYSDRFLTRVAEGYSPSPSDTAAARLEPCDPEALIRAYLADIETDYGASQLPHNLASLDLNLLAFAERIPPNYSRLDFQRQALLEAARIWRQLDTQEAVVAALGVPQTDGVVDESALDQALVEFVQQVARYFSGYPNQREALIRLVQLWRTLDSREDTIQWLQTHDPRAAETNLEIVDPALMAFVESLPLLYQGRGDQRFALTEAYRLWRRLDSRSTALKALGIDPNSLVQQADNPEALKDSARQVDRALLSFIAQVPQTYRETPEQREALIRLVQIWRRLDNRIATIQSLFEDLRRMARAERNSPDAMPAPKPAPAPPRPARWTPSNLQLAAPIVPNGSFTWAEATHGGTRMPTDQATVNAVVRIATLAQQARDRIGRPFHVTSWYRPPEINRRVGGASASRHIVGDAIDFYCPGLSGDQLYRALDPWWPGGLGRYRNFPYLCHLDARSYRARWTH
ncbi:MAG TPA: D-Ala-D-Ala carboxypeptidase family metallohydrolase [Trichocoleus sp.]